MFSTNTQQLPCELLCARLGPDRSRQLVGYGGKDKAIHINLFSEYSTVSRLEGLPDPVTALAFNPDQTTVVGGSDGGVVRLWDVATEKMTQKFTKGHHSTVTDAQVHKSGQFVATVSTDKNLRIWDVRKSAGLQSYKFANAPLCAVQFSPNGKWVATGCARGVVRLYNLTTAKPEATLELHTGAVTSLNFHPELYYLAVGSGDGTLSVWNLETFQHEFHSKSVGTPIDSVLFCGNRLLAAADHEVHIYNIGNLSDQDRHTVKAPWTFVSCLAYAAYADELWFVETSGTTALMGKLGLTKDTTASALAGRAPLPPPLTAVAPTPGVERRAPPPPSAAPPVLAERRSGSGGGGGGVEPCVPPRQAPAVPKTIPRRTPPAPSAATPSPVAVPAPEDKKDTGPSELLLVGELVQDGSRACDVLHQRLANMKVVRSLWSQDQCGALAHLETLCEQGTDAGAALDFLTALQQPTMREKLTPEVFPSLLNVILFALWSTEDSTLLVALRTLSSVATKHRARMVEAQRRARAAMSNGHNDPLQNPSTQMTVSKLNECVELVQYLAARGDEVGKEAQSVLTDLS